MEKAGKRVKKYKLTKVNNNKNYNISAKNRQLFRIDFLIVFRVVFLLVKCTRVVNAIASL